MHSKKRSKKTLVIHQTIALLQTCVTYSTYLAVGLMFNILKYVAFGAIKLCYVFLHGSRLLSKVKVVFSPVN